MYRTHTCGELTIKDVNTKVTLAGWIQKSRDLGGMTFIDLRDRYGVTQLVFNMETNRQLCEFARKLGREFVVQVTGLVTERSNKNKNIPTGDIEILTETITILNEAETPPFTIEDETDGGDELRMKYRYLDLRRPVLKKNIQLRHNMAKEVRNYLSNNGFLEIETPVLIRSTPEGARDFLVPSRMNAGQFYALPQSPQTFKQLLMVSGYDKYFQIVKCFRDEDLRADRQPEFTQIDCEMSFVEQDDVLNTFEGLIKHLFKTVKGIELPGNLPRLTYEEAMSSYGNDKPDIRFEMKINDLTSILKNIGFEPFERAEYIGGICAPAREGFYSNKFGNDIRDFARRPQINADTFVYGRYQLDGTLRTSIDKLLSEEKKEELTKVFNAKPNQCLLIVSGEKTNSLRALSEIRLEMGNRLGLRKSDEFKALWVVDFPLLEWDEETKRFYAMHHPFTSPKIEDIELLKKEPGKVKANAYDMVINGVEVGGGSIRIHNKELQQTMFDALGFTPAEAEEQFGFLMNAFKYGAPPHGGIAYGFDRLVALFAGENTIRDVIAFPKNNSGRDVMIDSPAHIPVEQLDELSLSIKKK